MQAVAQHISFSESWQSIAALGVSMCRHMHKSFAQVKSLH